MSDSVLDTNWDTFVGLVDDVDRAFSAGRWAEAAGRAQLAGAFAWINHTGVFASEHIETILDQLREHVPEYPSHAPPVDVLHVVTQAYATGGHTQAIAQWIDRDRTRRHHVCLTQQGTAPLPEKLLARTRRGADLTDLTHCRGGLLERAGRLRALARSARWVIVHGHPHDVVPALALVPGTSGVVSVNHADHIFWLGTRVPGVLASMRESGQALAIIRRGISRDRTAILPRPLSMRLRSAARAEAKQHWGLSADTRLIVSAADAPKFRPLSGPSLLEMVTPVLDDDPRAVLLVAGASPTGEWLEAEHRSGGRIRALGRLPDVTMLQQAADVYLDSFPFSSLTSLLEAGSFGTPAVTFRGHPIGCEVLGADTPGIDGHLLRPDTADALRSELAALVADDAQRHDRGAALRDAIASTHAGQGWDRSLENVYDRALMPAGDQPSLPVVRDTGPLDELVAMVQSNTPLHAGPAGAARLTLPYLPLRSRLDVSLHALGSGVALSPSLLLPPAWLASLTTWRRSVGIRRPTSFPAARLRAATQGLPWSARR